MKKMRTIIVEPAVLDSSASAMEQVNTEYQQAFMRLYEQVDALKVAWQGKDNQAFTTQIQGYNEEFRQISALMSQYSEFLRSTARAYRDTQADLVSQVSRLTN